MPKVKFNIFYVNVGEGDNRNWDDFKNFGFVSAGHGPKYSKAISTLRVGDKVIAYLKGFGYVGVGEVLEEAVKANDYMFAGVPLNSLSFTSENFFDKTDDEFSEYVVKVNWLAAYDRQFAKWQSKSGLFTTPAIKASLERQIKTIEFVESEFGITLLDEAKRNELHTLPNTTETSNIVDGSDDEEHMTFEEWDQALYDQGLEIEDAIDAMGLSDEEVQEWEADNDVPLKAIKFIRAGLDDIQEAVSYAEQNAGQNISGNSVTYVEFFKLPSQTSEGQDFDGKFAVFNYFVEQLSFSVYDTDDGIFYHFESDSGSILLSDEKFEQLLSEIKKRIDLSNKVPDSLKDARFIFSLFETAQSGDNDIEAAYSFLGEIDIDFEYDVDDISDSYANHFGCRIWSLDTSYLMNQEGNSLEISGVYYNGEQYDELGDAFQDAEYEGDLRKTIAIVAQSY